MPKGVYERTVKARKNMSKSARAKPPMTDATKLKMSKSRKGHLVSDETKAKMSEYQKANPQTGEDIVEHHYIYDHSDLTKYTMKMTRSRHTRLHRLMQKAGIVVPHTNMKEDN